MKYLSVCSGIEAASVAWKDLGWKPVGFSEIEPFPCEVLKQRFPEIKNYGDMTKYKEWNIEPFDLLVGGCPCQAFSIAGFRKGLEDPRGNLTLVFLGIIDHFKPKYVVYENVPGILSDKTHAFDHLLRGLNELGYVFDTDILDAQNFGVAQRRKRVFITAIRADYVNKFEDGLDERQADGKLFTEQELFDHESSELEKARDKLQFIVNIAESEWNGIREVFTLTKGLSGNIEQGKKKERTITNGFEKCSRSKSDGNILAVTDERALHCEKVKESVFVLENCQEHATVSINKAPCLTARMGTGGNNIPMITKSYYSNEGFGRYVDSEVSKTLLARDFKDSSGLVVMSGSKPHTSESDKVIPCLTAKMGLTGDIPFINSKDNIIRKLTPIECERLQGFPDNWTKIEWKEKSADNCPNAPRYKALGNSMATPCMRYLGMRIQMLDNLLDKSKFQKSNINAVEIFEVR